ncbi:MAG: chemotaxis protein CheA [Isosphaeraceae bacterium]
MGAPSDEFVTQAREHLGVLEQLLLALEKPEESSERRERVDRCLRIVHSIKGDAGFLGLSAIRTLANAIENVLEVMRDQGGFAPASTVERLLVARDKLAALVDDPDHSGEADLTEILADLQRAEQGLQTSTSERAFELDLRAVEQRQSGRLAAFFATLAAAGTASEPELKLATPDLASPLPTGPVRLRFRLKSNAAQGELAALLGPPEAGLPLEIDLRDWAEATGQSLVPLLAELPRAGVLKNVHLDIPPVDLTVSLSGVSAILRGELDTRLGLDELARQLQLPGKVDRAEAAAIAAVEPVVAEIEPVSTVTVSKAATVELTVPPAEKPAPAPAPTPAAKGPEPDARPVPPEADRTGSLRINVELLDRLMTLASELTLIRNQSLLAFNQDDPQLRPIVQRLDAVTSALQETVLRTRMQPIGNLFGKFPRVVRDLGRQLGKQVEMTIIGRDVELDKTILEQLSDPLTHLVRNSVDHGLEPPADRLARGKPPAGRITLTATHEEGQIRIEIRDDGRGIDPQAVRNKALAMRLKTEAELDRMTPRELYSLILLPGFSTAKQVSEVSGRGVGMDVVKTNIELLEGSLTIDSHPGLGTSMILRMPPVSWRSSPA